MQELIHVQTLIQDYQNRYKLDLMSEYGSMFPQRTGYPSSEQLGDFVAAQDAKESAAIADLFAIDEPILDFGEEEQDDPGHEDIGEANFFDACALDEEVIIFLILSNVVHCLTLVSNRIF